MIGRVDGSDSVTPTRAAAGCRRRRGGRSPCGRSRPAGSPDTNSTRQPRVVAAAAGEGPAKPKRGAHTVIAEAKEYVGDGYEWWSISTSRSSSTASITSGSSAVWVRRSRAPRSASLRPGCGANRLHGASNGSTSTFGAGRAPSARPAPRSVARARRGGRGRGVVGSARCLEARCASKGKTLAIHLRPPAFPWLAPRASRHACRKQSRHLFPQANTVPATKNRHGVRSKSPLRKQVG